MGANGSLEVMDDARPASDFEAVRVRSAVRRAFLGTAAITLGRYEIGRPLGRGGAGSVYRAWDPLLRRDVAVKVLHRAARGLRAEAAALAAIEHPNVVCVLDFVSTAAHEALVMVLVEGVTLRAWLDDHDRDHRDVIARFAAVGAGLAAMHDHGLVHRDFKSDNVLVDRSGRAVLVDFGLVRRIAERGSFPPEGTAAYMAPEQAEGGHPDPRSDQYSFCAALREALGSTRAHSIALERIIARGLASDPAERWPDMHALLRALASRSGRRRRWVTLCAGLGVAALAMGASTRFASSSACDGVLAESLERVSMPTDIEWTAARELHDTFVAEYALQRASTCGAEAVDPERIECLREAADTFDTMHDLFDDGTVDHPGVALSVFGRMPDPGDCVDASSHRPIPTDRAAARRVARATLLWSAGASNRAAQEAEAVWNEVTNVEDCSTRASAAHVAGIAQQRLGNPHAALDWFERSLLEATRCRDDATAAEAAARAFMVAAVPLRLPDVPTYQRRAEAALARAGSPPRLRSTLLTASSAAYWSAGEIQRALETAEQAAAVLEGEVGHDAYELVPMLANIGALRHSLGLPDQAEDAYVRAASIALASRGADAPALPGLRLNIAMVAASRGQDAHAIESLRDAVDDLRGGNQKVEGLVSLAELELARAEYEQAKYDYERALVALGEQAANPRVAAHIEARLGLIAAERGDLVGAEHGLERARAYQSEAFVMDGQDRAWIEVMMGLLRRRQGRPQEALQLLNDVADAVRSSDDPSLRSTHALELAETQSILGRDDVALAAAHAGLALRTEGTLEHASALFTLARIERVAGHEDEARVHARSAREVFARAADPRTDQLDTWLAAGPRE